MKKKLEWFFYLLGILFVLCFIIKTTIDGIWYVKYGDMASSPFYVYVLMNTLYFLLPSALGFIAGAICRKSNGPKA